MAWFEVSNISWLQTITRGLTRSITLLIPLVGIAQFVIWLIRDWWAGIIQQSLDRIDSVLSEIAIAIGFSSISLPWAQINSVIPLTEMISLMIAYQAITVALIVVKWVRNFTPFIN